MRVWGRGYITFPKSTKRELSSNSVTSKPPPPTNTYTPTPFSLSFTLTPSFPCVMKRIASLVQVMPVAGSQLCLFSIVCISTHEVASNVCQDEIAVRRTS